MDAVVKTRCGEVRGSVADGIATFKGIPYVASPFGANRLRLPQPIAPWSGIRGRLGAAMRWIAFVFDTLGKGTEPLWGDTPPQHLADTMHAAWAAFATNGDCGWPKYDLNLRATMCFDVTSKVVDDPRSMERQLWEGLRQRPHSISSGATR